MPICLIGGRGTGKTSAAKILARAINCLNPHNGEPCNECEICKGAISGSLTDIVEMDAASNNSVEDIRQIRDEVNFLPTKAKYRVYIIDEVHMLSTGAFNALLKTLEEPPEHVKFILATTEPQKLPATILSRCQRFDFKKISNENIIKGLDNICKEINVEITKEALNLIAVLAEGAMRDSLSILERCIQEGNKNITEDNIKELIGIPKTVFINKILTGICNYSVEETLIAVDEVISEGKDINNILWEIIKYIKDILLYKTNGKLDLYNSEEIEQIEKLANNFSKERLINLIYELSETDTRLKLSNQKTIIFQAEMIKLCNNIEVKSDENGLQELNKRLNNLENLIKTLKQSGIKNVVQNSNQRYEAKEPVMVSKPQILDKKIDTSNLKTASYWPEVINNLRQEGKIVLYTNLLNTEAKEINDMTVGIEFKNGITSFNKSVLEKSENIIEVSKLVSMAAGKPMNVKLIDGSKSLEELGVKTNSIENIAKDAGIPFNVVN